MRTRIRVKLETILKDDADGNKLAPSFKLKQLTGTTAIEVRGKGETRFRTAYCGDILSESEVQNLTQSFRTFDVTVTG